MIHSRGGGHTSDSWARGVCGRIRAVATNQSQFLTTRQVMFSQLEGGRIFGHDSLLYAKHSPLHRAAQCSKFYWIKFVRHLLYISGLFTFNTPNLVCVCIVNDLYCFSSFFVIDMNRSGVEIVKFYNRQSLVRKNGKEQSVQAKLHTFLSH